ncbi:energy-coupling factor transporter transmembrane protein EcfT [Ancylobacter dichloromethanicus]|uniref:energy-coupling factor transporter transmembrane component T family protein n=1 Tax=Ancylobacter dichloromethanicus TaxID=518825 RepID=UPI001BD19618|nr:energy-coupling factor transporter transmembrane protein EcfT [Ancylobacter dichloromethanicus]MBS7552354.1 energy-coupling factor transporter transmembrane protein EcfT [Ancylobacter dichloromethanicus]
MISLYLPQRTWLHAVPAGWKLLALALISLIAAPLDSLPFMAALMVAVLALYVSLGKAALAQIALLRPLWPLFLILLALHGWNGDILLGIVVLARILAMVLLANAVTMTTRMDAMMDAVEPLLGPLAWVGVAPRAVALAVALMIRLIPLLFALWEALNDSWRARTGKRGGWRLLAPFCIQTLRLSHHTAEALAARGGAPRRGRR